MRIHITTRHFEPSADLASLAEDRFSRLLRLRDQIDSIHLVIEHWTPGGVPQFHIRARLDLISQTELFADHTSGELEGSLIRVAEKLDLQLGHRSPHRPHAVILPATPSDSRRCA